MIIPRIIRRVVRVNIAGNDCPDHIDRGREVIDQKLSLLVRAYITAGTRLRPHGPQDDSGVG
jgi:hypothetical protein